MKRLLILLFLIPLFSTAQVKVSEMTSATTVNDADLFLLVQSGSSKKVAYSVFKYDSDDVAAQINDSATVIRSLIPDIAFGSQYQIPFTNSGLDGYDYSSNFFYNNGLTSVLASGTAINGNSSTGVGIFGESSTGIAIFGNSTTGVSGVLNNSSGNTSNIFEARVNNVAKFIIDKDGLFSSGSNFAWNDTTLTIKFGTDNVYVGELSGNAATGGNNVFLGYRSGYLNTASSNVFLGYRTGEDNVSGTGNVFTGYQAGLNNTSSGNTFIGYTSGQTNTSGSSNTYLGYQSGNASNGGSNVFVGYKTGLANTGSSNVFVGNRADITGAVSNKLVIENSDITTPLIYGEFDNNFIEFNGHTNTTDSIGLKDYYIRFNESEGVHEFVTAKSSVVWQGALEDLFQVYNNTGAEIPNGTPVYFTGVNGDSILTIDYATSTDAIKTLRFAGVTTVAIANSDWGFATSRGKVRDMNTSTLSQVGALFLSTDSSFTNTKPAYPNEVLVIGGVIKVGTTDGIIYVNPSFALRRQFAQRDYNFTSQGILAGTFYRGGFYDISTTDANLTQASATQTYGTANVAYAAHPLVVCGGAGSVDAGVVGLRVTGTSITDAGVRTASDADTILTDITSVALNEYYEGKKFLGTVTYELITISGSPTTYSLDFNYGYAKYEDAGNRDFYIAGIEVVGLAGSNDTSFDIELLFHKSTGWTYAASGFVPGDGAVAQWSTDMAPEDNLGNGIDFAWKRSNLNQFINGDDSEGVLFRITTGAANSVQSMDMHITVALDQ